MLNEAPSKRENYVDKMKSIIPVDVFGKCTENKILRYPRDSKEEKEFLSRYKFYIKNHFELRPSAVA